MDVRVEKTSGTGAGVELGQGELEQINRWSRKKLGAEEVYTFSVRLCDNEVDRDGERFTEKTLEELAVLFEGKSGIFDHQWSARGQAARIYRTELVHQKELTTAAGDGYCYLKGYAYMVRTRENEGLIAEIEGGIKKEISVGCAVRQAVCSICGSDIHDRTKCSHIKGKRYDGKLCWADLVGASDAYEWSFVAVPAQKKAGVIKGMKKEEKKMELKEFLREKPEYLQEVEQLEKEAALGRSYLTALRGEVVRLGGLAEPGMELSVLRSITDKLSEGELREMKKLYEKRVEERYPAGVQLPHGGETGQDGGDGAFLI